MNETSTADQVPLVGLPKRINRNKRKDICLDNKQVIKETLQIGGSFKATKRKLAIGKDKICALKDETETLHTTWTR